jgi:hypothetical protein
MYYMQAPGGFYHVHVEPGAREVAQVVRIE